MRAKGWVSAPIRERQESARGGQVVVADSHRRWAADLTVAWTRKDGVAAILPVVDCGDRYVLACEVSKSQEAPVVLFPVDNGPHYMGGDCEALCHHWGSSTRWPLWEFPAGKAVAECFIETLKVGAHLDSGLGDDRRAS